MPRPTQARGRPGSRIIPLGWEATHAAIVAGARTGTCVIVPGNVDSAEPVLNADFTYTPGSAPEELYDGSCRVQAAGTQAQLSRFAEQAQHLDKYLVVIERNIEIPVRAVVHFTAGSDPVLVGRRMVVHAYDVGTLTWERDLYCTFDMAQEAA